MKSSLLMVLIKKEKENSTSTTKIVPSIPKKILFCLFDFTHSHQDLMIGFDQKNSNQNSTILLTTWCVPGHVVGNGDAKKKYFVLLSNSSHSQSEPCTEQCSQKPVPLFFQKPCLYLLSPVIIVTQEDFQIFCLLFMNFE